MIFQGDLIIKAAIELGMEDIRKQPWLIQDMLRELVENPYLKDVYGQKQIDACKEWFANNKIEVNMAHRNDKDRLPCVTISMGSSNEKPEMKSLADQSWESIVLLPKEIGRPIPYIIKPFIPKAYDPQTGILSVSNDIDLSVVVPGQLLVNPENGNGYRISDVVPNGLVLEPGLTFSASTVGVLPAFPYYKARREHTFFQETYNIGCHVHGDPSTLLWLHSIVIYSLARYRESLLEANGFAESVIRSSDMQMNPNFSNGVENAWSRFITLEGQVENSWLKSPRRTIESIQLKSKTKTGYVGGIIILSNLDTLANIDATNELWITENEDDS